MPLKKWLDLPKISRTLGLPGEVPQAEDLQVQLPRAHPPQQRTERPGAALPLRVVQAVVAKEQLQG